MEVTYRAKSLAELAEHFMDKAKARRAETPRRKSDRQRNEEAASVYEAVADMLHRTVLEK